MLSALSVCASRSAQQRTVAVGLGHGKARVGWFPPEKRAPRPPAGPIQERQPEAGRGPGGGRGGAVRGRGGHCPSIPQAASPPPARDRRLGRGRPKRPRLRAHAVKKVQEGPDGCSSRRQRGHCRRRERSRPFHAIPGRFAHTSRYTHAGVGEAEPAPDPWGHEKDQEHEADEGASDGGYIGIKRRNGRWNGEVYITAEKRVVVRQMLGMDPTGTTRVVSGPVRDIKEEAAADHDK